jgi:hypothetical protein
LISALIVRELTSLPCRFIPGRGPRLGGTFLFSIMDKTKAKLRGLSPRANYTLPSDRRLSAKLVATFADRGRVFGAADPHGRILGFLDRPIMGNYIKMDVTIIAA